MTSPVTSSSSREDDVGKLILRLTIGVLLLLHGIAKLRSGIGWMAGPLGAVGLPAFVGYGVFVGEVIAPLLAVAGKFTRLAGVVIAFNMLAAVLLVQRDKVFALSQGGAWGIELEALFLFGGICLFFLGSGRYALSRGTGRWD
jgi:putative oxidoreductase